MKSRELRDLTIAELIQKEAEMEDEIFRLKIKTVHNAVGKQDAYQEQKKGPCENENHNS